MADKELALGFDRAGIVLVAADGVAGTWSFLGNRAGRRDDIEFLERVAEDVKSRFPIDQGRFLASGFSAGGSMVWYLACFGHSRFAAYAPVAGAFWQPEPDDCPAGPQNVRHVHGTADAVVPMAGRRVATGLMQGDVMRGIATWRRVNKCLQPAERIAEAGMACQRWDASGCTSHRELEVCLHDGEHIVPAGWLSASMNWLSGLKR
jgi:polyhydroxybutyrate depolymerase